ncbi:TrmH family RNA methyltransferase [Lentilactobacillus sp. SPB1-3]|uniref:TrmH family RNA methyltransferase n=1 Tax=Lentilactobacillus terminaliae TaxID=3003483 RepID=A0ACD5DI72_9LACO|nr:RNA methyltransferase [Lentilactobacillus sp. SPB1-3]MCZ0977103.1 RNA methyltransferase [Lentilactobacillus sp. SPB1-3]
MEFLTSNQNQRVKDWKKLQTKKQRIRANSYIIEGWHLIDEAIKSGKQFKELMVVDPEDLDGLNLNSETELFQITPEIAAHISDTKTPQGIFAVLPLDSYHEEIPEELSGHWLLLDNVQDPGNLGTIVRTADAAGLNGVVLGGSSVDIYNPKLIRSMQGSHFHISLYSGDLNDWITSFKQQQIPVFGTELNEDAKSYKEVGQPENFALVMGNEGNGMSEDTLEQTDQNLYIPMRGNAESLNVAVAAGIVMFQLIKS